MKATTAALILGAIAAATLLVPRLMSASPSKSAPPEPIVRSTQVGNTTYFQHGTGPVEVFDLPSAFMKTGPR